MYLFKNNRHKLKDFKDNFNYNKPICFTRYSLS